MRTLFSLATITVLLGSPIASSNEEDSEVASDSVKSKLRWNLPVKTAGGTQIWTDHVHREGMRIQQNALTGHWRLLDSSDIRRAWGTREQCQLALDDLHSKPAVSNEEKHVVVLLHGLMRTHHSMKKLEGNLKAASPSVEVIRFSYASTRASIGDHAAALREVLEDLPENTRFHFVGHSMGNIVVRHMVGDLQQNDAYHLLDRCDSMVMLGPPNQGAAIARRLAPTGLFGIVTGQGGMELGPNWDEFVKKLATPPFPFAIVAGDMSETPIQNPLVDGSSDLVVSVEEAKLEGCEAFHTLPILHSFMMDDPDATRLTIDFIQEHRHKDN